MSVVAGHWEATRGSSFPHLPRRPSAFAAFYLGRASANWDEPNAVAHRGANRCESYLAVYAEGVAQPLGQRPLGAM